MESINLIESLISTTWQLEANQIQTPFHTYLRGLNRIVTEMLSPDLEVSSITSSSAEGNGTGGGGGGGNPTLSFPASDQLTERNVR